MDDQLIKRFTELCDTLNATQGTKNKVEILKNYMDMEPLIKRMFDDTTTGVTAKSVEKYMTDKAPIPSDNGILQTYDDLATRKLTGDHARGVVAWFVKKYGDIALKIFGKTPRIRLGQAILKTVFTSSFVPFGVELAQEYKEADLAKMTQPIFMSQKFDGMRAITIIEDDIRIVSRTNKPITTAKILIDEIAKLGLHNVVLDGEIEVNNNFKQTISEARRKDVQMENPTYKIFNICTVEEFAGNGGRKYSERIPELQKIKGDHLQVVEQIVYTKEAFDQYVVLARKSGWEGIMLRADVPYEPKRTRNLLKYKFIQDGEYTVISATIEDMQFPDKGGEITIKALKNVLIHHLGDPVHVGSGFNREERIEFAKNPNLIVGKNIVVEYQEPFVDEKTGKNSLRCPIYKGTVGIERDY